jgi:hypothetical protein
MSDEKPAEAELVEPTEATEEDDSSGEVHQPAKVMRIASMIRTLLDEVRAAPLDEASRARLREIYQTSVAELSEVLSDDLKEELARLSFPFEATPSDAELRVAHAQLVGWLEGLFHGLQAMMFAQQMEGRMRMEDARRRGLPAGMEEPHDPSGTGQYL